MASFPEPPRPPLAPLSEEPRDDAPQILRPDHYDHDLAYARTKYPELMPKKQERVKMPKWMVLFLFGLLLLFVLSFAKSTFLTIGK